MDEVLVIVGITHLALEKGWGGGFWGEWRGGGAEHTSRKLLF